MLLQSQKWKLENGKAYEVHLVAGSRSVEAKALAETNSVTIPIDNGNKKKRKNNRMIEAGRRNTDDGSQTE